MRSVSGLGRVAALAAVIAAVVLVALVLFGGGSSSYQVTATFINAGQLVKGNQVQIDGVPVGAVEDIKIADNGQAEIKFSVDDENAPLSRGTKAVIRQASQSGIANRYIDIQRTGATGKAIPDGGQIAADETETAVDLDQLFNTLDPKTRVALQEFFKGSSRAYAGVGEEANKGFQYLNPALSTSSRLFRELTRDTPLLERFLIDSSKLVTALAERRDDLAGLVGNLNETTRALGNQKAALAESIELLPPFMRRANTTFVNLRAALNDVDPLVDASKPVAKRLQRFLPQLRRFTADAEPTVKDLSRTIRRAGPDNDLINLTNSFPPLNDVATVERDRRVNPTINPRLIPRPGQAGNVLIEDADDSFDESTKALLAARDEIAFSRGYTKDFLGWFDDFSATGGYDALGGFSRSILNINPQSILTGNPKTQQFRRCPGAAEEAASDGSNVPTGEEVDFFDCDPSDRATGPP
jgi:phospholipid/cholesterol/gamma-HCH transport system substrate-binding protein